MTAKQIAGLEILRNAMEQIRQSCKDWNDGFWSNGDHFDELANANELMEGMETIASEAIARTSGTIWKSKKA